MGATIPIREAAVMLRSRNAGAYMITIDMVFKDRRQYEMCRDGACLTAAQFAEIYDVPEDAVDITVLEPVAAIKITIPRRQSAGHFLDTDLDGAQQYVRLLDLRLPTPD